MLSAPAATARRPGRLLGPVVLSMALFSVDAQATKPRLRLERVDASRCGAEGLIDAYLVEIELEGQLRRFPASRYRLVVDGKLVGQPPQGSTTFARSGQALELAVVVAVTPSYEPHLPRIREGLRELMGSLGGAAHVTLIVYDWQARRLLARGTARRARQMVESIGVGSSEGDPALDEALVLALRGLGKRPAGARRAAGRRLMVLISDGINRNPKWDVFRGLGSRARTLGVTIHPVAFSPIDERGPLLNLGELAKRTGGTLRWARRPVDLPQQLYNLGKEIGGQLVQTYRVPGSCARRHRIQVTRGGLTSNVVESPAVKAGARPRERGVLGIVIFVVGLVVALGLLTLLVVVLVRPRRDRDAGPQ